MRSCPDPAAHQLTNLMRTHYNALYDYGLKLTTGDTDLTKDCIQEVFVAFWQHRAEWPQIQSVRAYLLVALRRKVIDAQRARRRFVPMVFSADTDEEFAPVDFAFPAETPPDGPSSGVQWALNTLTRRQREAIFLRFLQELDYADVARIMNVRERTVYNLVHEGLQHLRQTLTPMHRQLLDALTTWPLIWWLLGT